ncbi:astacin-like protein, partial [Dinothrombium tinctorium]
GSCVNFQETSELTDASGIHNIIFTYKDTDGFCGVALEDVGLWKRNRKHVVYLTRYCIDKWYIAHAVFHVLGVPHEVNRPDRDDFVQINFGNLDREDYMHFQKHNIH